MQYDFIVKTTSSLKLWTINSKSFQINILVHVSLILRESEGFGDCYGFLEIIKGKTKELLVQSTSLAH